MKKTITCEDAGMLISRNLDSDLDRAEVASLYNHLAGCAGCRARAAEMARTESATIELARAYESHSVGSGFTPALRKAIAVRNGPSSRIPGLVENVKTLFASRAFAAISGAALGLVLFFTLFMPQGGLEREKRGSFMLHPISFHSSSDSIEWHHDEELAPGHSLRVIVQKGFKDSFHIKLESSVPAELEILHESDGEQKSVHKAAFSGIRYGSLHSPRKGDVMVIRNLGSTAVRIKAHTVERGNTTVSKTRNSAA